MTSKLTTTRDYGYIVVVDDTILGTTTNDGPRAAAQSAVNWMHQAGHFDNNHQSIVRCFDVATGAVSTYQVNVRVSYDIDIHEIKGNSEGEQ